MNGSFHVMKKEWGTVHLNVNRSPLTITEQKLGFAELKILNSSFLILHSSFNHPLLALYDVDA
jgi:hypothetical protein